MKRSLYILIIIIFTYPNITFSQVGIGNLNPDTTTVLDLTNTENKGLLLPSVSGITQMSMSDRMLYFYDNQIYLKRTDAYNALSVWKHKFNGNISNDIYYNLGGYIGVGSTDITITPEAPLHIETINPVNLSDNGALMLGKSILKNIVFNNTEIQTRNIASSSDLKINEDGGDVFLGKNTTRNDVKVTGSLKELHHPTNEYYNLVPPGIIIMWYGDSLNIPLGWALCNGKIYDKANGNGTLLSPDLRGKFVVASGNNGSTNYSPYSQGGQDSVTLSTSELPSHNHNVHDVGHSHTYSYTSTPIQIGIGYIRTCVGSLCTPAPNKDEVSGSSSSGSTYAAVSPMTEDNIGGGGAHENRPKFYTLVYIMKL